AAPSSADGTEASKFLSMESSVWQLEHSERCAAALASEEVFSVIFSSVSSGRHYLVVAAASCHIFKFCLLSAMVILLKYYSYAFAFQRLTARSNFLLALTR